MSPAEAQTLLAIAASFDNRKPDETASQAWSVALQGYRFEDCRDAIVQHYRTSTDWVMVAHVIAAVKKTRTSRLEDVALTPPAGMDPDDTATYQRWLRVAREMVANGLEPPNEHYPATRQIGELRGVLRQVPAIEAKPATKTAEHQARLEQARAELEHIRAAIPALREIAEHETETEHGEDA